MYAYDRGRFGACIRDVSARNEIDPDLRIRSPLPSYAHTASPYNSTVYEWALLNLVCPNKQAKAS